MNVVFVHADHWTWWWGRVGKHVGLNDSEKGNNSFGGRWFLKSTCCRWSLKPKDFTINYTYTVSCSAAAVCLPSCSQCLPDRFVLYFGKPVFRIPSKNWWPSLILLPGLMRQPLTIATFLPNNLSSLYSQSWLFSFTVFSKLRSAGSFF